MIDPRLNIPSQRSTAKKWMAWYDELRLAPMNKLKANEIWLLYWNQRQSDQANDVELRNYMASKGVIIETGILGKLADVADDVTTYVGDTFEGIGTMFGIAKWVGIGFAVVTLGSIALLIFNVARKPIQAAGAAAKFTPAGAAAGAINK